MSLMEQYTGLEKLISLRIHDCLCCYKYFKQPLHTISLQHVPLFCGVIYVHSLTESTLWHSKYLVLQKPEIFQIGVCFRILRSWKWIVQENCEEVLNCETYLTSSLPGLTQSLQWLCYGLESQGSYPGRGKLFFSDWPWEPLSLLFNQYWFPLSGLKWSWHEFNHSSPSRAEIRNEWKYISTRLYSLGCSPDTTPVQPHLTSNIQQTKNETTNVVINIIVASSWWWA